MIKIEVDMNNGNLNIDAEGNVDIVMTELSTAVAMIIRDISRKHDMSTTETIKEFCDTTYESWVETEKEISRVEKYMNEV